jgi:GDPmannose 4,6-dehydratase
LNMQKMKKTIVIGATGQDGYYLANSLEQKGHSVIRIDKNFIQPQIELHINSSFDICEPSHVDVLVKDIQPDEIYHLAAFHHSAQDSYDETLEIFSKSINTHEVSLFNLLTSITKYSPHTKLFYAASSLIFGDPPTEVQDENTPINPTNIYGITKASGLFLCRKFRKEQSVFASCGILYNHESPRRQNNFLSKKIVNGVIAALGNKSAVLELGNLESVADWGYAVDYVEAMIKILSLSEPDDFIVSTGIKHTVQEFVEIAYSAVGLDWRNYVSEKRGIIKRITRPLIGDSSKLRNLTGWEPSVTFEEMVKTLVAEGINNVSESKT